MGAEPSAHSQVLQAWEEMRPPQGASSACTCYPKLSCPHQDWVRRASLCPQPAGARTRGVLQAVELPGVEAAAGSTFVRMAGTPIQPLSFQACSVSQTIGNRPQGHLVTFSRHVPLPASGSWNNSQYSTSTCCDRPQAKLWLIQSTCGSGRWNLLLYTHLIVERLRPNAGS